MVKNFISKIIVGNLVIALAAFASCSSVSSRNTPERTDSNSSIPLATSTPLQPVYPPMAATDLALLKRFAERYEPKSGREVIPSPPVLDGKLAEVIARASETNSREHEKYVLLIFLKLSRFQIENFRQRYELGRDNPLTKEFYRLLDEKGYEKAEMMSAGLADNYVRKNSRLFEYAPIKTEMRRIEKAGERILQQLRRTEAKRAKSQVKP